jgi:hypothetical protein
MLLKSYGIYIPAALTLRFVTPETKDTIQSKILAIVTKVEREI